MELADFVGRESLAAVEHHVEHRADPGQQQQPAHHGGQAGIEPRLELVQILEQVAQHRDVPQMLEVFRGQPDEHEDADPEQQRPGAQVVEQRDEEIQQHEDEDPTHRHRQVGIVPDDRGRDEPGGNQQPEKKAGMGRVDRDLVDRPAPAAEDPHRQRHRSAHELADRHQRRHEAASPRRSRFVRRHAVADRYRLVRLEQWPFTVTPSWQSIRLALIRLAPADILLDFYRHALRNATRSANSWPSTAYRARPA